MVYTLFLVIHGITNVIDIILKANFVGPASFSAEHSQPSQPCYLAMSHKSNVRREPEMGVEAWLKNAFQRGIIGWLTQNY
jgi:hypothetical protein